MKERKKDRKGERDGKSERRKQRGVRDRTKDRMKSGKCQKEKISCFRNKVLLCLNNPADEICGCLCGGNQDVHWSVCLHQATNSGRIPANWADGCHQVRLVIME